MLTSKLNQRMGELQTPTPAQALVLERELRGLQEQLLAASSRMREQARDPIPLPLPSLPQTFVGRVAELEILRRSLRQEDNPLTLIVAPAGFGKTTLVTKLLSEVASAHRLTDPGLFGVFYLSCQDGALSLERVFSLAGRMLGREEAFHGVCTGRGMPLAGKLAFFFGELSKAGTAWLVLDNLESLLRQDDSFRDPDLAAWFEAACKTSHSLRLIVTSRSAPRFPGSERLKPPALSRGLAEDEAILYLRREGAECDLAEASEELLRILVRRLDGIPKALESVVGYLAQRYPVVQLQEMLSDPRLLADFDRHDAESGMKHLIAEQFAQQSEDAQLLLCALSVFSRPAPLAALRFLLPALDLAPVLPRLVRNKLVRMERDLLSLHPLVKEWIYRQLPEEGEGVLSRAALHRKAADFYHSLRLPQAQWKRIEDLEPHLAEIRHRTAAGDDQEAAAVLEAIAETLEQWSEFLLLIELTEPLLERLSDPHLQASCRIWLGRALCKTGRGEEAISLLEQALELARRSADRPCEAIALRNLGIVYGDRGQLDRAEEHHRASLENARQIGDFMKEAIAFGNLGWVYHERGELPPAEEYFRASLEIACRIGDRYLEGKVLGNLGVVYSDRGELDRAEEHHRASLEITRQIGDREQEGIALGNLGMVHGDRGQLDRAEEHHRASLEIARRIGDRSTESNELNNLGLVFLERGDQVQARACWTEGLRVARECQSKSFQEESLLRLGELSRLEGDLVSAQAGLQEGLALAREIEDPWGEALGLLGQGKLEESRGDWESAKAFFQRSLAVAGESGYADLSAQARLALGRGYLRWHRPAEARTYLEKALAVELPKMSCLAALTLGIQELEEGNRPEAEQYLRRAVTLADGLLEKAPDRWEIRYARALAHLAAGEPEEAQADYARAITTFSAPGALQDAQADLALLRRAAPAIPGLDRVEELLRSAERASPD